MRFPRCLKFASGGRRALAALLLALCPLIAQADELKLSGFWIENVDVRSIENGELIYLTRGSEFRRPLGEVEGMRLEKYPQIEQAAAAIDAGDDAKAVDLLQEARKSAEEDWLKHYVDWRLVGALDRLGRGKAAASRYASLAQAKADPFFLREPPVASAAKMSNEDKASLADAVARALAGAKDEDTRAALEQLQQALALRQAPAAGEGPAGPTGGAAPPAAAAAVELPIVIPDKLDNNAALTLLRQGKFDEALKEANTAAQIAGGLSEKLLTKGLVELAIAETAKGISEDQRIKLYQDAGLSFMRVAIFFPSSNSAPAALMEAGYVHQKIGREDIAQSLYAEASSAIEADREAYPNYYPRVLKLTGAEAPAP